jgi:hypothetical protein
LQYDEFDDEYVPAGHFVQWDELANEKYPEGHS